MAETIKVDLHDPVETHQGFVSVAEFREPTGRDFFALGEPLQFVRSGESGGLIVERDEVILSYMERCVQKPLDPVLLGSLSLADALACREKFLGFFGKARGRT